LTGIFDPSLNGILSVFIVEETPEKSTTLRKILQKSGGADRIAVCPTTRRVL